MIDTPGIYSIPAAEYHKDPCPEPSLSSSIARRVIERSPLHASMRHPRFGGHGIKPSSEMNLGTVAHAVILENTWAGVVFIDAPDFRTKDAKLHRDNAYAMGLTPLLVKDKATVENMVDVMREAHIFKEPEETRFSYEQTLVWQEAGVWCRARLDALDAGMPPVIYDLKTTGLPATPEGWGRTAMWDYALQAAWYCRGYAALNSVMPAFRFVVQETSAPYAVRQFQFDDHGIRYGQQLADTAIALWGASLETGHFISYPDEIHTQTTPGWVRARLGEL